MKTVFLLIALFPAMVAGAQTNSGRELIQNGDFEKPPVLEETGQGGVATNALPGWYLILDGDADGELARESHTPVDEQSRHSLRLTVRKPGPGCGVANSGFGTMHIRKGEWYDLVFHARSEPRDNGRGYGLMVSLESSDGKKVCARATIPEVAGAPWKQYTLPLHARDSDSTARMVISMDEPGTIWFDNISLVQRKAAQPATDKSK